MKFFSKKILNCSKNYASLKNINSNCFFSSNNQIIKQKVVLLPGHGIGPEISNSVIEILEHLKVPIEWIKYDINYEEIVAEHKEKNIVGPINLISDEILNCIKTNKFALKGPFQTPIGKGFRSLNVSLRKALDLYANVRPCKSMPGIKTKYSNVDVVTIRENTEGEYSGLEHEVVPGVVENLKVITRKKSENIAKFAFEYAIKNKRKRVTVCHKAGIMKMGDGLFRDVCDEVYQNYKDSGIIYSDEVIDTICLKLALDPSELDLMVMPNLYGDIVSDLSSGLIGGLGLTPSGNIGTDCAIYEAVHGSAPDIAGKNLANPTALLLSACMMLTHMNYDNYAQMIKKAVDMTFEQGVFTGDLGGQAKTTDYTKAVIKNLGK